MFYILNEDAHVFLLFWCCCFLFVCCCFVFCFVFFFLFFVCLFVCLLFLFCLFLLHIFISIFGLFVPGRFLSWKALLNYRQCVLRSFWNFAGVLYEAIFYSYILAMCSFAFKFSSSLYRPVLVAASFVSYQIVHLFAHSKWYLPCSQL